MKKLVLRIFLLGFFTYFIFYAVVKIAFLPDYEIQYRLPTILLESFALSLTVATLFALVIYYSVRNRIKYIEKKSTEKPDFYVQKESYIPLHDTVISFDELKGRIKNRWVLTFFDSTDKVIKFRTKMNFLTWGTGCYLRYDEEIGALNLISFPVGADLHGSKRSEEAIRRKILKLCA